jgi:hypothetical protein
MMLLYDHYPPKTLCSFVSQRQSRIIQSFLAHTLELLNLGFCRLIGEKDVNHRWLVMMLP